ncbi:MAG: hypothetical protein QMD50_02655 [Patescibacteria group bacterium]|nr:hypothetical protein [Patescibacteria group bacterium]
MESVIGTLFAMFLGAIAIITMLAYLFKQREENEQAFLTIFGVKVSHGCRDDTKSYDQLVQQTINLELRQLALVYQTAKDKNEKITAEYNFNKAVEIARVNNYSVRRYKLEDY